MNSILIFDNVSGNKKRFGLHNVSFELEAGYIYSIAGDNGAGKTTLFKYITDRYASYDGNITVGGINTRQRYCEAMNEIGYISEDVKYNPQWSGLRNAEIYGKLYDKFDLELFKKQMDEMKVSVSMDYGKYSRGEKMKFQLAFAIAFRPSLYLADEATAGMDPVFRIEFFNLLRRLLIEEDAAVLMSSHICSDIVKQTDYVAVMKDGVLSEFKESMDWEYK